MNKKIKIVILLIIIVISLSLIAATMTFITRRIITNNVITFGNIKMQLIQTTLDENNTEKEVYDNEIFNITNTPTISRMVRIKNLGNQDFFARISLDIVRVDVNNNEINANELASYDINANDWIYKDGWYYYKKIVNQNNITSNLITQINFDTDSITKKYPKQKVKLNIKAEAVQAKNNANNVLAVEGWPSN